MTVPTPDKLILRTPLLADGPALHALIQRCPPLDCNTAYAYCIICDHFCDSVVVAHHQDGDLIGAVTAYLKPTDPKTCFIWQVAVDERVRGQGLAGKMLTSLLTRPLMAGVTALETTIGPGNAASRRMFAKLAEAHDTTPSESLYLDADAFPGDDHEAEYLLRCAWSPSQSDRSTVSIP